MTNPSFHFFQLQKIDLRIDTIQKRLAEIERIRNDNAQLRILLDLLNEKTSQLENLKTKCQATAENAHKRKLKIEQSEASLYSGTIKNPKELQDVQTEISSLRNALAALEDIQLQEMLELEVAEDAALEAKKNVEACEIQLQSQFTALFAEEETSRIEMQKISQERVVVLEQINPEDVQKYDLLRKTKKGHAVSQVEEGSCSICGQTLTPAEFQLARSPSQMAFCPSCGRILYAG